MSLPEFLFARIEASGLARVVGASQWLIAGLSAVHLIGFTMVIGAALLMNLRMMGWGLSHHLVSEVARLARQVMLIGLLVSVLTGVPLVSWRLQTVLANGLFQLKMLLLLAAVTYCFTWQRQVARRERISASVLRATGVMGLLLWLGLALAACAFILLE